MGRPDDKDQDIQVRAELLPEEQTAGGSEDSEAQAQAILEESEERVDAPHDPPDGERDPRRSDADAHEHRRSDEAL